MCSVYKKENESFFLFTYIQLNVHLSFYYNKNILQFGSSLYKSWTWWTIHIFNSKRCNIVLVIIHIKTFIITTWQDLQYEE